METEIRLDKIECPIRLRVVSAAALLFKLKRNFRTGGTWDHLSIGVIYAGILAFGRWHFWRCTSHRSSGGCSLRPSNREYF